MSTFFTWNDKKYFVDIEPDEWYENKDRAVKLPSGEMLEICGWKEGKPLFSEERQPLIAYELDEAA